MLHIPEAELHAYLDQALGRLRCVEIESHLAECTPCREARDEIAALRDRTTAMLARLAPRGTVSPPFGEIRRRAAVRAFKRERLRQRVAWAASVLVALGIGWGGAIYLAPGGGRAEAVRVSSPRAATLQPAGPTPATQLQPAEAIATTAPQSPTLEPSAVERRPDSYRLGGHHPAHQPGIKPERSGATQLAANGQPGDESPEAGGSSRSPSADRATAPARTEGAAVADAQGQAADSSRKASMIVAQQLRSGEVVRAAQGPVSDVATLLSSRPSDTAGSGDAGSRGGSPTTGNFSFRQGDRMFNSVGGNLPSDSLRAMMRRLNLMSRVR